MGVMHLKRLQRGHPWSKCTLCCASSKTHVVICEYFQILLTPFHHVFLLYRGPGSVRRLKADLSKILRESGFSSVEDAVGCQASTICSKSNST